MDNKVTVMVNDSAKQYILGVAKREIRKLLAEPNPTTRNFCICIVLEKSDMVSNLNCKRPRFNTATEQTVIEHRMYGLIEEIPSADTSNKKKDLYALLVESRQWIGPVHELHK